MYFIDEGRIGAILGEIKLSDWLELSENRCARANAGAVAAQRIHHEGEIGCPKFRPLDKLDCFCKLFTNIWGKVEEVLFSIINLAHAYITWFSFVAK
jgi:hypothetical protein